MSIFGHHKDEEKQPSVFIENLNIFLGEEKHHEHHHGHKFRPNLAFNLLLTNTNFTYMSVVTNLTLTSTAPVELSMTVLDANNNNSVIAGTLSGLSYNVDATQDIAVVDPNDPLSVDIHAVAPQGGSTVTATGNFVSTLLGSDGI